MLIAPSAVLVVQTADRRALPFKPDALGFRPIPGEILRVRHLDPCDEVDDDPDLFTLGGIRANNRSSTYDRRCEGENHDLAHVTSFLRVRRHLGRIATDSPRELYYLHKAPRLPA